MGPSFQASLLMLSSAQLTDAPVSRFDQCSRVFFFGFFQLTMHFSVMLYINSSVDLISQVENMEMLISPAEARLLFLLPQLILSAASLFEVGRFLPSTLKSQVNVRRDHFFQHAYVRLSSLSVCSAAVTAASWFCRDLALVMQSLLELDCDDHVPFGFDLMVFSLISCAVLVHTYSGSVFGRGPGLAAEPQGEGEGVRDDALNQPAR